MTALYRLVLSNGSERLAVGTVDGPTKLLDPELGMDHLLVLSLRELLDAIDANTSSRPIPAVAAVLAPIGSQEVWAAGVTYLRSRDARQEESVDGGDVYARVYGAERPEVFFKAPGWRVVGPDAEIGIRADSSWNVPEPELTLVINPARELIAYTIGNDVSSRSIEGENPLYLPQAKVYAKSAAIGPCLVVADGVVPPFDITVRLSRADTVLYEESASTGQMKRTLDELISCLYTALDFPAGAFLMTGTILVPPSTVTLAAGDQVAIEIGGLGRLENIVAVVGEG